MKDFITHPEEFVADITLLGAISMINKELSTGCVKDSTLKYLKLVIKMSDNDYFDYLTSLKDTYISILQKRNLN